MKGRGLSVLMGDFAYCMKELVDIHFPDAEVIRLVMDNLNTHTIAAVYEVFEPVEARRIAKKLEIHYTPKHGSWLNMVESELSVLVRQSLKRRIPDIEYFKEQGIFLAMPSQSRSGLCRLAFSYRGCKSQAVKDLSNRAKLMGQTTTNTQPSSYV